MYLLQYFVCIHHYHKKLVLEKFDYLIREKVKNSSISHSKLKQLKIVLFLSKILLFLAYLSLISKNKLNISYFKELHLIYFVSSTLLALYSMSRVGKCEYIFKQ